LINADERQRELTDEQKPFICSNPVLAHDTVWLTPEECVWASQNTPDHLPSLEWRIKTLGKKFIPEDEIDDKITDETVSAYACLTSAHHIQVFQSIILVWEGACATTLYRPRL